VVAPPGSRTGGAFGAFFSEAVLANLPVLVNAIRFSAEFGWSTVTLIAR